jgi:hypothetical protein
MTFSDLAEKRELIFNIHKSAVNCNFESSMFKEYELPEMPEFCNCQSCHPKTFMPVTYPWDNQLPCSGGAASGQ